MFKRIITQVVFYLSASVFLAQVPSISLDTLIRANKLDEVGSITELSNGTILIVGSTQSDSGFNKTSGTYGKSDGWILNTSADGTVLWETTIGGSQHDDFRDLVVLPTNEIIAVGITWSDSSGNKTDSAHGPSDAWVVKFSPTGQVIWQKSIGGASYDQFNGVTLTATGNVICVGSSHSGLSGFKSDTNRGSADYWLVELDAAGTVLWDKTYGGFDYDLAYAIELTTDNGYIIAGESRSGIGGDKTEAKLSDGSAFDEDYWVLKLNDQGDLVWQNTLGGDKGDWGRTALQTLDGGYIIGGSSESNSSTDKTDNPVFGFDFWLVKLDSNGIRLWDQTIGGDAWDVLNDLIELSDGGFFFGGGSNSGVSGDKTEPTGGELASWVVRTDLNGNILWDKTFARDWEDVFMAAVQTSDGGILCGLNQNDYTYVTDSDINLTKFGGNVTSNEKRKESSPNLSIYPNPTTDFIKLTGIKGALSVTVYSSNGSVVLKKKIEQSEAIDVRSLSSGVYTLFVQGSHKNVSPIRFIKHEDDRF